MSYDVSAGGDSFNYTSNMRRFFYDFGVDPRSFDGLHRYVVADRIESALKNIKVNDIDTLRAEYDPAPDQVTGEPWGTVDGAIEFLQQIREACHNEIPDLVAVLW